MSSTIIHVPGKAPGEEGPEVEEKHPFLVALGERVRNLRARRGLSVIVTTHQPDEAERCHRIAVLDAGRVVCTGTPDELRARVSGDVVRVEADLPEEIAATLGARLGLAPRIVDGRVCVEAPRGHELVPRVVELFPAGRLRSVATARPTLADVFAQITGHGLGEEARP